MTSTPVHLTRVLLAAAAALLVLSVTATPVRAQKPNKDRQVMEDQFTIPNPCGGEDLTITERYLQMFFVKNDAATGCDKYTFHLNDMGATAVSESGSTYQATYTERVYGDETVYCDGCTIDYTTTVRMSFLGHGTTPDVHVTRRLHLLINTCTWDFTWISKDVTVTCGPTAP